MKYIAYLLLPLLISLLLTPISRILAQRARVFAHTNGRTVHSGLVPKWGGMAIFAGILSTPLLLYFFDPALLYANAFRIYALLIGSAFIFVLGTFDDKFDLDCNLKLLVELLMAFFVVYSGWRVDQIVFPGLETIDLGWLSFPLSVLWIVGLTNAINLVDGLDGLASGIVLVASLINVAIAAMFGNILLVYLSLILAGAVAGFLWHNLYPASIFMGDSGSLPLGFVLSSLTIGASSLQQTHVAIVVPILLLAIPITDTMLAIVRRMRQGIHPFHADRLHIHHRLVRLGLSQGGAALVMVGMSCIMGILAFIIANGIREEVTLLQFLSGSWLESAMMTK